MTEQTIILPTQYVWSGGDASEPGVYKEILLRSAVCSICETDTACLQVDNSGGEYAYVNVCAGCAAGAFRRAQVPTPPTATPVAVRWTYCNDHGPLHAFAVPDDWDRTVDLRSLCGSKVHPIEQQLLGVLRKCAECERRLGAGGPDADFRGRCEETSAGCETSRRDGSHVIVMIVRAYDEESEVEGVFDSVELAHTGVAEYMREHPKAWVQREGHAYGETQVIAWWDDGENDYEITLERYEMRRGNTGEEPAPT